MSTLWRALKGAATSSAADDVAEEAAEQTARRRGAVGEFARSAGEGLGRTPERVITQPVRSVEAAADSGRKGLYALGGGIGVGGAGLGAGGALRAREQRMNQEDQRETVDDVLDDPDVSDDVKDSVVERALREGLFDGDIRDLGGDPEDPDNIFENIWFRRVIALLVIYYGLKTINSQLG